MAKSPEYMRRYRARKKGEGGGAKSYTTADKTVEKISPAPIESRVGGGLRIGVFDVVAKGNGEIRVREADFTEDKANSSRKYKARTYTPNGAYIDVGGDSGSYYDDRDETTSTGVNWDNVTRVSGGTYYLRTFLKKKGFRWNSSEKVWER